MVRVQRSQSIARVAYRAWSRIILLSAVIALSSAPATADGAWFGLKLPEARNQRSAKDREVYLNPDLGPLSLRLPESKDPYTDIRGEEIYQYLQEILNITEQTRPEGERYWGRIAGSASEIATAEYMADHFREFGLDDVRTEPVAGGKQWWPINWEVTLVGNSVYGDGTEDQKLTSAFPAVHLASGALSVSGLEAELEYVGLGRPVDLIGRDLTGKIAVMQSIMQPSPFFQSARGYVEGVVEAGAVGVLVTMEAPENHQYVLEGMGPETVPTLILGGNDGRFVQEAIAANVSGTALKARLMLETEVRDGWQGRNVLGLIKGSTDEYVVIVAHLDGYFLSANDNGGGLASMLALAKYFARQDTEPPKRNLLFVGTSGHHEFSDGVKSFIAGHSDVLADTVLIFNVEHPSSVQSYYRGELVFGFGTVPGQLSTTTTESTRGLTISNGSTKLISIYRDAIDRYGQVIDSTVNRRPTGDAFDFYEAGHTVVQILDANLWYHSTGDLIDTMHRGGLERATRLYAYVLDGIDRSSRVQLEATTP